jgi:periplasmic protein TonB
MRDIEILNANLLDIIFENRNKSYGAYALRKFYTGRLTKSLSVSLGLVLLLFLLTLSANKNQIVDVQGPRADVQLIEVVVPPPKPVDPPKPVEQTKAATAASFNKIIFVDRTDIVPDDIIKDRLLSSVTKDGPPLSNIQPPQETPPSGETNTLAQTTEAPAGITKNAEYPGGNEKFTEFLKTKLMPVVELEPGQKLKVLVRFKVDVDGSISQVEVLESGGAMSDNEVIRVLKKMPKWSPAMQNGIKVSSYFTQTVTFIGQEQ